MCGDDKCTDGACAPTDDNQPAVTPAEPVEEVASEEKKSETPAE